MHTHKHVHTHTHVRARAELKSTKVTQLLVHMAVTYLLYRQLSTLASLRMLAYAQTIINIPSPPQPGT